MCSVNELFVALITSVDIFGAVLGLYCSRIKLPALSAGAVALVGAAVLCAAAGLSETAAVFFGDVLPMSGAAWISKGILALIGLKVLLGGIRDASKGRLSSGSPAASADCNARTVHRGMDKLFGITGSPEMADCDNSSVISLTEAALLGLALSADSVFTGIGAGIGGMSPGLIFIFSFSAGLFACCLGSFMGRLLCRKESGHFPAGIITGIGLIVAAIVF